ncbi:MAG: lysophospholipid acyltransferase family protein [Pseudomonadota bacterium]
MAASTARAGLRTAGIVMWTAVMALPVLSLNVVRSRFRHRTLRLYFQVLARLCGLRISTAGPIARTPGQPVLFVSNHVSYLDVIVLGATVHASFVSKAEVLRWPAIGWLAKQVGTTFIERRARRAAGQVQHLAARLRDGDSLVLFPEGTSTDGTSVLPFKSTLFAALGECGRALPVQPVSLLYRADHMGGEIDGTYRCFYAWFGDDDDGDFGTHAWRMLQMPGLGLTVQFHDAELARPDTDRKSLAERCERSVAAPLQGLVSGISSQKRENA